MFWHKFTMCTLYTLKCKPGKSSPFTKHLTFVTHKCSIFTVCIKFFSCNLTIKILRTRWVFVCTPFMWEHGKMIIHHFIATSPTKTNAFLIATTITIVAFKNYIVSLFNLFCTLTFGFRSILNKSLFSFFFFTKFFLSEFFICSVFAFKEPLTAKKILGLVLGLCGLFLVNL